MRYLELSETLEIYRRIIAESGGAFGVRNLGALENSHRLKSAAIKHQTCFAGFLPNRRRFLTDAAMPSTKVGGYYA